MKFRQSGGFALPSVLMASVIMMTILVVSVASTAALRASLSAQYYNQLAKNASDAGIAYARSCIEENAGVATWSDINPLKPNTDCSGVQLAGFTCPDNSLDVRCSVFVAGNIISVFSVSYPEVDDIGNITKITSEGATKLIRDSNASTWRQYNQTSQLTISNATVSSSVSNISLLVVGGGGGGASGVDFAANGGGGGGGGVLYYDDFNVGPGSYPVDVGDGGAADTSGQNSSFGTITAVGGGRGGGLTLAAQIGGSGGGGGTTNTTGAAGTLGQGYTGANHNTSSPYQSGGGGGVSEAGNTDGLGYGGDGVSIGISGSMTYYGGGGGGGADASAGLGGDGGGGNGVIYTDTRGGYPGTDNTGGGGGGGASRAISAPGGAGGSGIVIISYPTGSISATGGTETTNGGNTVHTFTADGTFSVNSVGTWSYKRPIGIINTNTSALNDHQVQITPFTDSTFLNNSGLVGSWHFNEDNNISNTTAYDMSGNGNNGVMYGSNYRSSSGRFGGAFWGNGVNNNRVDIPYSSSIDQTTSLTIEAWFKFTSSGVKEMISRMNAGGTSPVSYELYQNGQKLTFRLYKSSVGTPFTTNTDLALDTWHHVVATWDGTNVNIYVDGALDMTPGTLASPIDSSSFSLSIGGYGNNTFLFDGTIDEVKVYSRALSGPLTNCIADSQSEVCQRYGVHGVPKVRSDYGDIRFTNVNGSVQYSYWQETDNKFWVKIPSLAAGNSAVYMYYGNPYAVSSSNGENTFAFFDDFRSPIINTAKWVEIDVGSKLTQSNGSLILSSAASAWDTALISKVKFYRNVGIATSGTFKASSSVAAPNRMMVGWEADQEASANYSNLIHGSDYNAGLLNFIYENNVSYAASGASYVAYSYNLFDIKLKSTGADYSNNGTSTYTGVGGSFTTSPLRIGIHQYNHTGNIYYIFVRQGSLTEPTSVVPGAEAANSNFVTY